VGSVINSANRNYKSPNLKRGTMKNILVLFITLFPMIGLWAQEYGLEECVRAALLNKETIQSAALDVELAKAGRTGSWSEILPSVSLSGNVNESKTALSDQYSQTSGTSWRSSVNVSQTIYDGGAWWNTIASKRNDVNTAVQLERQIRTQVILRVVEAYFQLLKAQELLEVYQKGFEASNQNLEIVEKKYDLGSVSKTDLLKAKKNTGQSKVQVLNQQTMVDASLRSLKNTMGLLNTNVQLSVRRSEKLLSDLPEIKEAIEIMKIENPEILTSESQIRKSELDYKLTRALRLPSLSANVNYGTSAEDPSELISGYTDNWDMTGSLSLSLPIFTGLNLSSREKQSKILVKQRKLNHLTTINEKILQLKSSYDALNIAKETLEVYNDILTSAEEDLKLARERYALGSASILEVLDAQVAEIRAEADMITTQYDARIDEAYFKAHMGVLGREFD